jgi:hypothetical protein
MATNYEPPQIESRHPIAYPLIGTLIGSGVPVSSAAFRRATDQGNGAKVFAKYEAPGVQSRELIKGALVALSSLSELPSAAFRSVTYEPPRIEQRTKIEGALSILGSAVL